MRTSALTWPFPFLVRLGWATAGLPNPIVDSAAGRVYFLRGNGMVFSGGFGTLCGRLRRAGIWTEDLRCVGDLWLRRHIIKEQRLGRLRGPIILVGHSCGGRSSLHTARCLEPLGITIDLLICVDVALPFPVAGNVRQAVHLYRTHRRIYRARPLQPAPGSHALIDNIDLDADDSPIRPAGIHHLNITKSPAVQDWIMRRIVDVCGG